MIIPKKPHEVTLFKSIDQIGEWFEDNRRVYFRQFKSGLNHTFVQMVPLNRFEHYQVRILFYILVLVNNFSFWFCSFLMWKQSTLIWTIGFLVAMPLKCMIINDIGKMLY